MAIDAGTLGVEAVLLHRNFQRAKSAYAHGVLQLYDGNPLLNKMLTEAPRQAVFGLAIHTHARALVEREAPPLTISVLRDLCGSTGVASRTRVEGLVGLMRKCGYLVDGRSPNRRMKVLVPSAAMLEHDRRWLTVNLWPVEILQIGDGSGRESEIDVPFVLAFRRVAGTVQMLDTRIHERHPAIEQFVTADGGFTLLLALLFDTRQGEAKAGSVVALPYTPAGRRFGISRTQVRQILARAQAEGLVSLLRDGGQAIRVEAKLTEAFDRWFADQALQYAKLSAQARQLMAEERLVRRVA